jgi:hypothetical protein
MNFSNELFLLEQPLLEILNLRYESDNLETNCFDGTKHLKPALRPHLAARLKLIEIENFCS